MSEKKSKSGRWLAFGLGMGGAILARQIRGYLFKMVIRRLAVMERTLDDKTPDQAGLPYEEVWFRSRDSLNLHGWFIPAEDGPGKATIIMGHGHGGSKVADLHYADFFRRGGYSVFMFDFRGHGRSDGPKGTSMGYWERFDVVGAVDWLRGRGINRVGMFGISMGAAIAILSAAENPDIKAVVSDSAYAHLRRSIAAEINNMWGIPMWFGRLLGWWAYSMMAQHHGFSWREGNPADVVEQISPRPILFIHAEEDLLTRVENAHILYKKAKHPKELWIQPGIGHVEGYGVHGATYEQRVLEFLDKVDWEAPAPPAPPAKTLEGIPLPQPVTGRE